MAMRARRLGIVAMFLTTFACGRTAGSDDQVAGSAGAEINGLQGAWHLAEYRPQDGATVSAPASLYLFTDGNYSILYANTEGPRGGFASPDTPTDAEKLRAYDTFIANAGAYAVAGDTLIVRPQISKHPNFMGGGEDRLVMRQAGDTLWLTSVPGAFRWAGGQAAPATGTPDSFILVRTR